MVQLIPSVVGLLLGALWLVHVAGRQNVDPSVLNDAVARLLLRGDRVRAQAIATVAPHAPYCAVVDALLREPDPERHPAIVDAILAEAATRQAAALPYAGVSAVLLVGPVVVLGWQGSLLVIAAGVAAIVGSLLWSAVRRTQRELLDRARRGAAALSTLLAEVP
jgi:hypothetical protein